MAQKLFVMAWKQNFQGISVFADPYVPEKAQNQRFCLYTRKYRKLTFPRFLRSITRESAKYINDQCSHHIETSHLICNTNQLTGFYMRGSSS